MIDNEAQLDIHYLSGGCGNGLSLLLHDVGSFHLAADQPVRYEPVWPHEDEVKLRHDLIAEEFDEFTQACAEQDLVGVADALADLIYVVVGAAHHFGIPLDKVWDEVQLSNMSKVDPANGKVRKRPDGKVLKGPEYFPPNVRRALGFDGDEEARK